MMKAIVLLWLFGTIQTKVFVVTADVYFGEKGPYRFLVDTGSQSTLIEPSLARELGLQPEFRTEIVTLHGSHFVPGTHARTIRLDQHAVPEAEVLFQEVAEAKRLSPTIRGVLGANVLASFDYQLSPAAGKLESAVGRPDGEAIPFHYVDGRIVVNARMGKETLALIIDSGASHPVLFRTPQAMAKTSSVSATVNTLDGVRSTAATTWTADLLFGERLKVGTLPAAIVSKSDRGVDGLIPASAFQKIFVDQARREVVLVR